MSGVSKTCGTCRLWDCGELANIGSLTYRSKIPECQLLKKTCQADDNCWGWKEADPWDLVLRKRAGYIDGDYD